MATKRGNARSPAARVRKVTGDERMLVLMRSVCMGISDESPLSCLVSLMDEAALDRLHRDDPDRS
jgi:hypothetical protein